MQTFTPERRLLFLDHLARVGSVRAACAAAGISAETVYRLRRRDALFAQGWAGALVLARSHAEDLLATRALDGVEEHVWYRGELVGTRRRFDARLLLAHLARLDRLTEDDAGTEAAARFDELLALNAGLRPDPELAGGADRAGEGGSTLPPLRGDHIEQAGCRAEAEAVRVELYADDGEEDDAEDWPDGDGAADWRDPIFVARDAARERAGRRWDGWFAGACALVDRRLAGVPWPAMPGPDASWPDASWTVSTVSTPPATACA